MGAKCVNTRHIPASVVVNAPKLLTIKRCDKNSVIEFHKINLSCVL